MKNRRYFIDLILIVALVVVAFSVYPRKKGSSEKKEKSSVTTSAKTEAKTTEKKTTEKKTTESSATESEQLSEYEKKYGKEFCAFVYDEVSHKISVIGKRLDSKHWEYTVRNSYGEIQQKYTRFGVVESLGVVYECRNYQYDTRAEFIVEYEVMYSNPELHDGKKGKIVQEEPFHVDWYDFSEIDDFKVN